MVAAATLWWVRWPPTTTGAAPAGAAEAQLEGRRPSRAVRITVPAGAFVQGSAKGDDDERPTLTRTLKAFVIDRTEITRSAYASCVAAHRCKGVPQRFVQPTGSDGNLPITGVTWFDARDYCQYAQGRLPTEAEWEKAARGSDGREFPWGDESACGRANWGNYDGEGPCAAVNPGFPVAVGRYESGASPYGVLDLAGNVWEWVADRYGDEPHRRVVRGGSCCSFFVPPRAANRNAWDPTYRDADLGFRCAADR
jgi:formylglycine-generating enzyme required for sulfatase activity